MMGDPSTSKRRRRSMGKRYGASILISGIAAILLFTALGRASAGEQATQQVAGGGVTVAATLLKGQVGGIAIQLALNTHSVNLDAYKFEAIATLRDDGGKVYPVEAVEQASGGGHHRQAVLRFANVTPSAKAITIIVRDVAGVKERTFRWSLAE
jgi:hypothetical protein